VDAQTLMWPFRKRDRERTCTRKVRYGHKPVADRAAEAMHAKYKWKYSTYECELCGGWHVGRKGFQFRFIVAHEKEGNKIV
jgi:hypothetical protein